MPDGSEGMELTGVRGRRDAAASLAVDVADVLLEGSVGHTARAVGDGAVVVLGLGGRGDEGNDGQEGDGELHVD
jgi:hypothetical protein